MTELWTMRRIKGSANLKKPEESPSTMARTVDPSPAGSTERVTVMGKEPEIVVILTSRPGS